MRDNENYILYAIIIILLIIIIYQFKNKKNKNGNKDGTKKENVNKDEFIIENPDFEGNFGNLFQVGSVALASTYMVDSYYNLVEKFCMRFNGRSECYSPQYYMDLLTDKKVFQGNNKFACKVFTSSNGFFSYSSNVYISIKYSQGFRVLMASIKPYLQEKLNNKELLVLKEINRIYSNIINSNMTQFEKEKTIHDYLIKTSMYDANGLKLNSIKAVSHTPYGLLFEHMGVCDAYAETFQIFMFLCGIESYVVIGNTIDNQNGFLDGNNNGHAWNIVRLGNNYYHVDVTFDNPGPMKFGQVNYGFFNLSDNKISRTHLWDYSKYPQCIGN